MQLMALKNLQAYNGFESISGTAEQTGLPDHSAGLITVAQAFHSFDPALAKQEFQRILRPGGYVLLALNILLTDTAFLKAYDAVKEKYAEKKAHADYTDRKAYGNSLHPIR